MRYLQKINLLIGMILVFFALTSPLNLHALPADQTDKFKEIFDLIDQVKDGFPTPPMCRAKDGDIIGGAVWSWNGWSCVEAATRFWDELCGKLRLKKVEKGVDGYLVTGPGGAHTFLLIIIHGTNGKDYYLIIDPWMGRYDERPGTEVPRNGCIEHGGASICFDGSGNPISGDPGGSIVKVNCPPKKAKKGTSAGQY